MRKRQGESDGNIPFYAAAAKYKTSAEIISEARAIIHRDNMAENSLNAINSGSGAPRTLGTQRPFTPRERQRTLFGKAGRASRPPSAVNLKYLQHQTNDNTKNTTHSTKKGQLSPVTSLSSSFDERLFSNHTLDNIDERGEFSTSRKRKDDNIKRSKTLNSDQDQDIESQLNSGSKLKLPSLLGLAKPLHQRKAIGNQRSSHMLQSLSEEREDTNLPNQNTFSPLILTKSDSMLQKSFNIVKSKSEDSDHFPNIQNTISLEVFNKRRLFGNYKSKSDEIKDYFATHNDQVMHNREELENTFLSPITLDIKHADENYNTTHEFAKETNSVKIAVQIPSQELPQSNYLNNTLKYSMPPVNKLYGSLCKSQAICTILDNLSNQESKSLTDEDVIEMLIILYNTLEKDGPWQNIGGSEKAIILKILYTYIESSNERLLIAIARIILALRVTGSNLSGACKLIFKIARNDKNDHLFLNDNLLELFIVGLGRAEPLHDAECLVYGYGALKFLGMNLTLLEKMRPLGVLPLMTLHLKMFNEARTDDIHAVGEQGCHGLYQLTGALRNMAGGDITWSNGMSLDKSSNASSPCNSLLDFIEGGTLTEICRTVNLFTDDLDVETNASRTLSVLSADYECCVMLCEQNGILSAIIKLLQLYTERTPLVVRLTYILGNMVACNNNTRLEMYEECGAISVLLKVLDAYLKRCWPGGKLDSAENIIIGSDLDGSNGSDEDVMVKTIRVIANICMNPSVGTFLTETGGPGERVLTWILKCLRQHAPSDSVELTVSTLAALNNLSYYHSGESETTTAFSGFQIHFCEALCHFLHQDVGPCVTEAIRVLGNMSRSKVTRDYIVDTGALMDITRLTENDDEETAIAAAGVLVNMAGDDNARYIWTQSGGIRGAAQALHSAALNHRWQLAHLLCQALWNATPLPHTETSLLAPLLLDILDEQQVFGSIDMTGEITQMGPLNDKLSTHDNYLLMRLTWEEFAAVAVNLLEKIDPTIDSPLEDDHVDMFTTKAPNSNDLIPI